MPKINIFVRNTNPEIQPDLDKALSRIKAQKVDEIEYSLPLGAERVTVWTELKAVRKKRRGYKFMVFLPDDQLYSASPPSFRLRVKRLLRNCNPIDFERVKSIL